MSGIVGIYNFRKNIIHPEIVKKMTDSIAHRGPDDEGYWIDPPIALGHRRLAIIDLSHKAHQPMLNEDKTVSIVFNGEIFNYADLRPLITSKGYTLFSQSDTEIILRLYEIYGIDAIEKLRGIFAFAIWDKSIQKLFLVRDRIGVKPLYYLKTENAFIFGSEIKAILASNCSNKYINLTSFLQYMRFLTIPQPTTIFKDIHKLEPGSYMIIDSKGRTQTNTYWDVRNFICTVHRDGNEDYYRNQLEDLLTESVRYNMVADVPVGAFLSGGLDSSSVVAMMRNNYPNQSISTFSTIFPGQTYYDESNYAQSVADRYQTIHYTHELTKKIVRDFEKIVWHLDEPFAISSAFALYYLAEEALKRTKVVLTGDGGDELFAGYEGYKNDYYLRYPEWIFEIMTKFHILLLTIAKKKHCKYKFILRLMTGLGRRVGNEGLRYSEQVAQNSLHALNIVFERDFFLMLLDNWGNNLMSAYYNSLTEEDKLSKKLYADFKTRLVDEMLMKVDRMSMAHSLEARVPLLDHKLVEFAFSLPSNIKLRDTKLGKVSKYIFKKTMEKYLPREIIYRKKHPFNIPIYQMIIKEQQSFNERLYNGFLVKNKIINKHGIELMLNEIKAGNKSFVNMLVLLITFEYWLYVYQEKFGSITLN